jgi:hypothetical protein
MYEGGRAGRGFRTEKRAQFFQVNGFRDVKEVEHAEVAARNHVRGRARK